MSGNERVGRDLTHYLAISGMGPLAASDMVLPACIAKSDRVDRGQETGGNYRGVVGSRVSTFITPRMLKS
jgi:hypothetical protein